MPRTVKTDLSTAIRSFLKRAIAKGGMPFDVRLDEIGLRAAAARSMRETAKANGNDGFYVLSRLYFHAHIRQGINKRHATILLMKQIK
jgi:hypothetical protein